MAGNLDRYVAQSGVPEWLNDEVLTSHLDHFFGHRTQFIDLHNPLDLAETATVPA
jgi:hypothetical protein